MLSPSHSSRFLSPAQYWVRCTDHLAPRYAISFIIIFYLAGYTTFLHLPAPIKIVKIVPPRSKYSRQHHILKHPQLPFLPQCQRPSLLHSVQYNNCSVRIVSLNMAGKAEICTRNKTLNVSVIHKSMSCWLHHSLKKEYAVKI